MPFKLTIQNLLASNLFKNSVWGGLSNILQNILFSVFFIIMARIYSPNDFGSYLIANNIYSLVLGFSSLGLGHWFIREWIHTDDKPTLTGTFFKTQLIIGLVFYIIHVGVCFLLYDQALIRSLALIIGINILFDNVISVIKSLNVAELKQWKSFLLITIEAFIKCAVGCVLFFYPMPVIWLSLVLIGLRLLTLNLFITWGTDGRFQLARFMRIPIHWSTFRTLVLKNWAFLVISSMAVLNWKIGGIVVSKFLSLEAVAEYEVAFKLLTIAYILPIIISQSMYPMLIRAEKENPASLRSLYQQAFYPLAVYGLLAYAFVVSYADTLIPLLFGPSFTHAALYCRQLFLVMLVFPTIFLQANVMLTLKLEKTDMLCNLISVVVNLSLCLIGMLYWKQLDAVNYAIFCSFVVFHVIQDWVLVRKRITSALHVIFVYGCIGLFYGAIHLADGLLAKEWIFPMTAFILLFALVMYFRTKLPAFG